MNIEKIEAGVRQIIDGIGDDAMREGLQDTPRRVAETWVKFFQNESQADGEILSPNFHAEGYDDFVVVRNVQFSSFCEHHILPFFGTVSIAYIPKDETVIGLSKLARIIDKYSKRLQIQERLTQEIHDAIRSSTKNDGVVVIISAEHMCMSARGVMKQGSNTVTRSCSGRFATDRDMLIEAQQIIIAKK